MQEIEKNILVGNYSDIDPNLPIPISQEEVEVECNDKVIKGEGRIELSLLPSPAMQIQIDFPASNLKDIAALALSATGNIKLPQRNISADAIFSNRSFGSNEPLKLTAIPMKGPLETKSQRKIFYIIFYLLNYWNFIGSNFIHKLEDGSRIRGNRLFLETDGWKITIESLPATPKRTDLLRKQGGYGVTHIGIIKRADNKVLRLNWQKRF